MTLSDNEKLRRHREAEQVLQALARVIEEAPPDGMLFCLQTFTPGGRGYSGWVSNARREDMIKALREAADTLEARMDGPPFDPNIAGRS